MRNCGTTPRAVRAFNGLLMRARVLVDDDGTVKVYDIVAGHYTTCHSLSARECAMIRTWVRTNRLY